MAAAEKAETKGANSNARPKGYTSVVYFHGIGSQRRYEETSRLIDQLDKYQYAENAAGNPKGMLSNIKARVEPLRAEGKDGTVGYIRTVFTSKKEGNTSRKTVRFYEVYWAPIMADIASPAGVIKWAFSQVARPLKTVLSPWRERQRLRRGALHTLFKSGAPKIDGVLDNDCGKLLDLYDKFEGLEAQRRFGDGSFKEFCEFIGKKNANKPNRAERLQKLAKIWRKAYWIEEARNLLVLITIALALILLAFGVLQLATAILQPLITLSWLAPIMGDVTLDLPTVAMGLVSFVGFLGFGKLLANYLGDVEAWSTYSETDSKNIARNKVLDHGMEILSHALNDEGCDRVVVVGHSLGTSIANDSMLALARHNRAVDIRKPMDSVVPLNKIDQFITLGSPIDKMEYFFESFTSESHRFKRVKDALRGDINTPPFSNRRIPRIHWVNFWDDGDPISGPLQSPSGSDRFLQKVDDVHVATYSFPAPAASHSGYFENRTVIGTLYDMIFQQKSSYWPLSQDADRNLAAYETLDIGPGVARGERWLLHLLVLSIPWLSFGGVLSWALGHTAAMNGFWIAVAACLAFVLFHLWLSKDLGSMKPI